MLFDENDELRLLQICPFFDSNSLLWLVLCSTFYLFWSLDVVVFDLLKEEVPRAVGFCEITEYKRTFHPTSDIGQVLRVNGPLMLTICR